MGATRAKPWDYRHGKRNHLSKRHKCKGMPDVGHSRGNISRSGALGNTDARGFADRPAVQTWMWEGGAVGSAGGGQGIGGRRSKGKGKGSSWGGGWPRHVQISKTLTKILRHKAPDLGISIDRAGFCKTEEVLATPWLRELSCTSKDVEKVVKDSDKQRFEVQVLEGVHHVRAVQGHSIEAVDDEASLQRLLEDDPDLPEQCIHGTYARYLASILESGLKPGGAEGACSRKHVHFSPFEPGDKKVISGMRYDADIAVWVDLRKAMQAGIPFYISPNKVILSPGIDDTIPSEFFQKVTDVKTRMILHDFSE